MIKFTLFVVALLMGTMNSFAQAPRHAANGITFDETPEDTLVDNLQVSFNGIAYSWLSGFYDSSTEAAAGTIVEGTDGNLYIKGMTPNLYDDELYWIKAEKTGDGEYVIKKQPAGLYTSYDELDYLTVMEYSEEEGSYIEAAQTDLKVTYKDGVLAQADPNVVYGIVYEDEGSWTWEGEVYWNLKMQPMTETYATLPEGAVVEKFVLQHANGAKDAQVAFVGDKVYVQSYATVPGWYVGTISDNKVTFKSGQFLGFDTYYESYQWLVAATVVEEWDEEYQEYYDVPTIVSEVTFDLDAATKTMTAPEGTALYINGGKDKVYYAEAYKSPKFFIFNEVVATPADPVITKFWPYDESYENAELDFSVPLTDVDGNYITPDKLSYKIYVDDQPFTFTQDEYEGLDKDYDELPYGFTDNSWIGQTYLCIFFDPAKNIGIQSIYRGLGVEKRSNIVYYNVETGETEIVDAIGGVETMDTHVQATYDLTGRKVSAKQKGLVLKTVTLSDGTSKTIKVINK